MIEIKGNSYSELLYEYAKFYISKGLYVIPLRKNEKALPEMKYGIGYGNASKDPDQIDEWFGPDGRFNEFNIGIACGKHDGVFVVDQDMKDWPKSANIPECPTQLTPRGGKHYIMNWREGAISSTSKLEKNIDTRGGTVSECKSHIVAAPSTTAKGQYTIIKWPDEIPDTPNWIMDKFSGVWQKKPQVEQQVINNIPLEQIKRMIESIDPENLSYEEWVAIGQAINSQYPNDEGLAIWDEWSKGGSRYVKGECYNRWSGFESGRGITVGTMFKHAKREGWTAQKGDVSVGVLDRMVDEFNEKYAIVLVGGKTRIINKKPYKIGPNESSYDLFGAEDFKLATGSIKYTIESKTIPFANIWLAHEGAEQYKGIGMFPDGKVPNGYYNSWRGLPVEPAEGDCSPMLDHIRNVICNNDRKLFDWLIDWLADLVQNPTDPKGTAVVMKGKEGCGKGTLGNLMMEIFGRYGKHIIDDSHLLSNFNSHMIEAIFVFADEVTWGGNSKSAGKLKGMITEKHLLGERKGVDAISYVNMAHLMIASNSDWVVPATSGSRRWFVLEVSDKKIANRQYWNDLYNHLNNGGGTEAFLHYLLGIEITNDLRTVPVTEGLRNQIAQGLNTDTVVEWMVECLFAGKIGLRQKWEESMGMSELYSEYKSWCAEGRVNNRQMLNMIAWSNKLSEMFGISSSVGTIVLGDHKKLCEIASKVTGLSTEKWGY